MPYIVAPGSVATVAPNELLISEGTLIQDAFKIVSDTDTTFATTPNIDKGALGKIKDFLDKIGNKMYTLVVVKAIDPIVGTEDDLQGKSLFSTKVFFNRIKRNDVVLSAEDAAKALDSAILKKYLTIETNMNSTDSENNWFIGENAFENRDMLVGVIASAWNGSKWLRSTEYLNINKYQNFGNDMNPIGGSTIGLDFAYGLGLWTNTNTSMVTSDKLLNGGKLEADPDSFRPVG